MSNFRYVLPTIMIFLIIFSHSTNVVFAQEDSEIWERKANFPESRTSSTSVAINEKIFVLGGENSNGQATDSVFVYDVKKDEWSLTTPMPIALHHLAASTHNEKIYVIGGYSTDWKPMNTLLIYDTELEEWKFGKNMPTSRGALSANFVSGKLYAIGGYGNMTLSVTEEFDPLTNTWISKSPMPTAREHLASASTNNEIYVIGGFAKDIGNLNSNEVYYPETDSWEILEPMPTARNGLTVSTMGDIIFAIGGESKIKTFEENEAYFPREGWVTLQPLPIPRHGLTSSVVNDSIFVLGGGVAPGPSYSSLVHSYQNTAIPEFGTLAIVIFGIGLMSIVYVFKYTTFTRKLFV